MIGKLLAATAVLLVAAPAAAQVTVDGTRDAAYGAAKSSVAYNPLAPNSNFGTPTNQSDASSYDIYLTSDANNVYGFFQSDRPGVGAFTNLYFDLNPPANDGSDLGFEISSGRVNAFIPGLNGQPGFDKLIDPSLYSVFASGNVVEFALSNSLFNAAIPGLAYYPGQTFPANGESVVLRLSQSFGYSVAGGATYGPNRLGAVAVAGGAAGAVPEPASWAMMIGGLGLVGGAMRRRQRGVRSLDVSFA